MVGGNKLEITHAFPFPDSRGGHDKDGDDSALDGHEYQIEMIRMLREVNVDNNCVGWYQSMYLGIYSTSSLLENQLSYQTDLSPNAVVILYDPIQTSHGNMVLKCYRLTEECIKLKEGGKNSYIDPKNIFEEVPVKLTNPGLAQALLTEIVDGVHDGPENPLDDGSRLCSGALDTTFDRLDLSTTPYLEKHMKFLCEWVDDLSNEQQKFQSYTRQLEKSNRNAKRDGEDPINSAKAWESNDAPSRMESLLVANQIQSYCDQMNQYSSSGLGKLYLVDGLQKGGSQSSPASSS